MDSLAARFAAHVSDARLFPRPGTAVVAVSGGADSVALLDLLTGVATTHGLALVVAHADHGIRADSPSVGHAVGTLAARHGFPFELGELQLGPGASETTARRARYAWLRDVRRRHGARYIVTAHQRDDQVETILLRVLRGSAPAGLAGIAARSRGGLVRPLLPFARAELAAHVAALGLPYDDDPTNRDPAHLRAWVRTALVPLLVERLGADARAHLLRLGRHAAAERRAWSRMLELLPELAVRFTKRAFEVAREPLRRYDDAVAAALLRAAARRVGLVLGPRRAAQLLALARGQSGRRSALGGGWEAEAALDRLSVARAARRQPRAVARGQLRQPGVTDPGRKPGVAGTAVFGDFVVRWAPESAPATIERRAWVTWLDGPGWQVRAPRPGDRVSPLGGVGRRALRRLLMEARVPRSERAGYPVLVRGETILWVPGVCRSAEALPPAGTRAVRLDVVKHAEPEADRRA